MRKFFIFSLVFNRSTCVVSFIVKWNLLSSLSRGRSGLSITKKKKIKKISRRYRRNWCRNREISMVERYSRMNWTRWMPSIRSVTRGTPSRCTTKTLLSKNVSRAFRFFMILVWSKRWLVNLFASASLWSGKLERERKRKREVKVNLFCNFVGRNGVKEFSFIFPFLFWRVFLLLLLFLLRVFLMYFIFYDTGFSCLNEVLICV